MDTFLLRSIDYAMITDNELPDSKQTKTHKLCQLSDKEIPLKVESFRKRHLIEPNTRYYQNIS